MRALHVCILAGVATIAVAIAPGARARASTPEEVVNALLDADRSFSKISSQRDLVEGLTAMFAPDVVMPVPGGRFARGIGDVKQALRSNSDNAGARAEWTPIRGGISADGHHGFTFGYMTVTKGDGARVPLKYLSYWISTPQGWRVAAYKRNRGETPPVSTELMPPALPARLVPVTRNEVALEAHRRSLDAAERAFSDEAQTIGIGPAFAKYGSEDAINLGPPSQPAVTVGAEAIGRSIGSAYPPGTAGVSWAPESVIVASSGDLGVTIGFIRPNGQSADATPARAIPFFTIWRRPSPGDPWRYIAE